MKSSSYQYKIIQSMSQNTFLIEDQDGNQQIMKKYLKDHISDDYLIIYETLQRNPCGNIVKVLQITRENDIILEKCDYDLNRFMKIREQYWFTNEEIFNILGQIVNGYQHLKKFQISHRQLAPSNILIKQIGSYYLFKISNFQLSKLINRGLAKTIAGLPLYIAPEIFEQKPGYTDQCDIYSLGILLHQLCFFSSLPFQVQDIQGILQFQQKIKYEQFKCQIRNNKIQQHLIDLIEKMIVYKPEDRITWEELANSPKLKLQIKLIGEYLIDFQKKLGSGMQGAVYETINTKTQQICCTKIIDNESIEGQREKDIYQQIKKGITSIHIIQIFDIFDEGNQSYIILEKCDENLMQFSRKNQQVNDEIIAKIMISIVQGYDCLRRLNVIHRDLKPENIMIKYEDGQPTFKIIDFGIGKIIDNKSQKYTMAGTPLHSAPEILLGYPYNDQCDIFSFGTMMYWFIFRKQYCNPISLEDLKEKAMQLKTNPIKCPTSHINQKYISIIEKMLIFDPNQRITWESMRMVLENNQSMLISQNQFQSNQSSSTEINENREYKYLDSLQIFAHKVQTSISLILEQQLPYQLLEQLQNLFVLISNFNLAILLDIFELIQKKKCLISYYYEKTTNFFQFELNNSQNLIQNNQIIQFNNKNQQQKEINQR